jgi:uncharacterized protein (TIGR00269 family)
MCIYEKEIATYLMLKGEWTDLPECPYACHALRREVRGMLAGFEYEFPGTMLRLMENKKAVEEMFSSRPCGETIRHCTECGDPSSGDLCQLCRLRHSLGW